ncbi:MAG: ABC transporter permease [Chitinophagaceae bacterium]
MIRNYFKIALRNIAKNKVASAINISGLALGMAACLLILQYVSFELSYDQFHGNASRLFRVVNDRYQNGKLIQHGTITYSAIGKAMKDDYPQDVETYARVEPFGNEIVTYKDKKLNERILAADNSFLTMFSFPLLAGDPATALKEPNTIIFSEELARKVFDFKGDDFSRLLGETIVISHDSMPYKVTGICKNVPENSHLSFNMLLSYSSLYSGNGSWKEADYDFTDSDFWHYIQLKPGVDQKAFEAKLGAFSERHFRGNKVSGSDEKFYLQPLGKAHLYSDMEYEIGKVGTATTVWGLLIVALFIIAIAWVNYINLSTARSMDRAKEVGIRKVVGSLRAQLIVQFMIESVLINAVALLIALLLVYISQPFFNQLLQQHLSLSYLLMKGLGGYSIAIGIVLVLIAGILLSGFYPAFVLSSFKPIQVLKGKFSASTKGIIFRKVLVVGQFSITVALVIGSLVVYRQLHYVSEKSLGINVNQVLVVSPPVLTSWDSSFIVRVNSFKNEVKQLPHVKGAASSYHIPGDELGREFKVKRADATDDTRYTFRNLGADYDFIPTYGIKLLAGRTFSQTDHDSKWKNLHNAILNEKAVKQLGYANAQDAIGKQVIVGQKKWDIVGVVDNFHQKSLHYAIEPLIMFPTYSTNSSISVKVDVADLPNTIAAIKQKYASFFPGNLFDYYFLDKSFKEQYNNDRLFGEVFGLFAGFAVFTACLGLFGLSLFSVMQRTREIGVRKVLGASVQNILVLVSKDFIKLVMIAIVIAFPLAFWVMDKWLQGFAYRTNISAWIFVAAGCMALVVALGTISWQAAKAALSNPVRSLRNE